MNTRTWYYHYFPFLYEETEVQRGQVALQGHTACVHPARPELKPSHSLEGSDTSLYPPPPPLPPTGSQLPQVVPRDGAIRNREIASILLVCSVIQSSHAGRKEASEQRQDQVERVRGQEGREAGPLPAHLAAWNRAFDLSHTPACPRNLNEKHQEPSLPALNMADAEWRAQEEEWGRASQERGTDAEFREADTDSGWDSRPSSRCPP